jgi:predicted HTH transcriptional regulator
MMETQNIEYKSAWRDEYIKWICGFANVQGGMLYIGKDDNGKIVGLNERQIKAVLYVKEKGEITNGTYQKLNNVSKRTATTELTALTQKFALINKIGTSGSNIYYVINLSNSGAKKQ